MNEQITPVAYMRVTRIVAGNDGAYLTVEFPVSYEAFNILAESLRRRGLDIHPNGGGGTVGLRQCSYQLGPFKESEQAAIVLSSLQAEIQRIYNNEHDLVGKFAHLKADYPIGGS